MSTDPTPNTPEAPQEGLVERLRDYQAILASDPDMIESDMGSANLWCKQEEARAHLALELPALLAALTPPSSPGAVGPDVTSIADVLASWILDDKAVWEAARGVHLLFASPSSPASAEVGETRKLIELANEVVRAATDLCEDIDATGTTSPASGDTVVYAVPIDSSDRVNAALDALIEALPDNEQPVPARALDLVVESLTSSPSPALRVAEEALENLVDKADRLNGVCSLSGAAGRAQGELYFALQHARTALATIRAEQGDAR